jgi:DNA-binding transcriptional MerR regulator
MDYRVEELAATAGIRVDTVRFYQAQGLLERPRRVGRVAIYEDRHLERLRRIRALSSEGFSLAQIQRLLVKETSRTRDEPLLAALEAERRGERSYSRAALAAEAGVPESLIAAVVAAGLMQPVEIDGDEHFGESDLRMARSALAILQAGLPIDKLLRLAVRLSSTSTCVNPGPPPEIPRASRASIATCCPRSRGSWRCTFSAPS